MSTYAETVRACFNYAVDKNDGGEFSNTSPARTRQNLHPVEMEIRNARSWSKPPSLTEEGVMLAKHGSGKAEWDNPEWIDKEYVPSCMALVKQLTGAREVYPIYAPLQRRVDYDQHLGAAPAAGFIHLDQTLETAQTMASEWAGGVDVINQRAVIFNVWKCITPAPQDYPLAVSDIRSIASDDLVFGETVEYFTDENGEEQRFSSPYYSLTPSEEQVFYYYPDMNPDESLVFVGVDLDPAKPLGCAHSAFQHPAPQGETEPRASIETRILAIFD